MHVGVPGIPTANRDVAGPQQSPRILKIWAPTPPIGCLTLTSSPPSPEFLTVNQ